MINQNEVAVVKFFINNPDTYISAISEYLQIPKSTVQRYLQHNGYRKTVSGKTIAEQLEVNKARGNRKGGENSFKANDFVKDAEGKFIGSTKTTDKNKVEEKEKDIKVISTYYLENDMSLEELSSFFEDMELYTKSYVYRCLTSNRSKEVLGEEVYLQIQEKLKKNRTSQETVEEIVK